LPGTFFSIVLVILKDHQITMSLSRFVENTPPLIKVRKHSNVKLDLNDDGTVKNVNISIGKEQFSLKPETVSTESDKLKVYTAKRTPLKQSQLAQFKVIFESNRIDDQMMAHSSNKIKLQLLSPTVEKSISNLAVVDDESYENDIEGFIDDEDIQATSSGVDPEKPVSSPGVSNSARKKSKTQSNKVDNAEVDKKELFADFTVVVSFSPDKKEYLAEKILVRGSSFSLEITPKASSKAPSL